MPRPLFVYGTALNIVLVTPFYQLNDIPIELSSLGSHPLSPHAARVINMDSPSSLPKASKRLPGQMGMIVFRSQHKTRAETLFSRNLPISDTPPSARHDATSVGSGGFAFPTHYWLFGSLRIFVFGFHFLRLVCNECCRFSPDVGQGSRCFDAIAPRQGHHRTRIRGPEK